MSLLNRLSVKRFAAVPALLDLPEIEREPASVCSDVSSRDSRLSAMRFGINLEEGCFITKSVKYTHQVAHIVNAVRKGDPRPIQQILEMELRVIPYIHFSLDDPCNLMLLESFVHTSFDLYAFIALAPSSSTATGLIEMVKADNDRRQQEMNENGLDSGRSLNFLVSGFSDPQYELISLHPEHFLPRGARLSIYDPDHSTWVDYVASNDRRLRQSADPHSASLPPFRHSLQNRPPGRNVNIFLVAMNAEIKFRRYFKMIQRSPPTTPLPIDVLALMHRVTELINLLYWAPVPSKGSRGEVLLAEGVALRRKNPGRAGRSSRPYTKATSGEESGMEESHKRWKVSGRTTYLDWSASLEERKAYGSALMSGHDISYDPALFENAPPTDDTPRLYSDRVTMEAWNQGVVSEHQT